MHVVPIVTLAPKMLEALAANKAAYPVSLNILKPTRNTNMGLERSRKPRIYTCYLSPADHKE